MLPNTVNSIKRYDDRIRKEKMSTISFPRLWLPSFMADTVPEDLKTPEEIAEYELSAAVRRSKDTVPISIVIDGNQSPDSWETVAKEDGNTEVRGAGTGILYGVYDALMKTAAGEHIGMGLHTPAAKLRMINCWDNLDGSIERGYAGRSLFFFNDHLSFDPGYIRGLARLLATIGINRICINNVNVLGDAHDLIGEMLPEVAKLASVFRPFGIRLLLSIDFSQPLMEGRSTADPLSPEVQEWWNNKAKEIWAYIPDFGGFLVKADSENRPGPYAYGRTHADGANMLARAVKPFGGIVIWRCFVYNCRQDWRDPDTDRPKAAYENYIGLDGSFDENVILQVKHGPFDFQVEEPVSPLLLGMKKTRLALEIQLAQEYTGQQIDIYSMPPMWDELKQYLKGAAISDTAAVGNFGDSENLTGHPFAALNLFAYGLYALDREEKADRAIRMWVRLSYPGFTKEEATDLADLLLESRSTYRKYTSTLGLNWMVNVSVHYGPSPSGYEFSSWGTYNRADRNAVGIDRTKEGTGYTLQYPEELDRYFSDPATCPDELLLFFHRLPYTYRMRDKRTLIQRIYDDHFEGYEETKTMAKTLEGLPFPEPDRSVISEKMKLQLMNAREWRDVTNTFFHRLSGIDDEKGRKIYP